MSSDLNIPCPSVLSAVNQSCDIALNCDVDDLSHNMILPVILDAASNNDNDVDNLIANYPLISVSDDVTTVSSHFCPLPPAGIMTPMRVRAINNHSKSDLS